MLSSEEKDQKNGEGVPAFLMKLWKLVGDPRNKMVIYWSNNGDSFVIKDETRLCQDILPIYFKHNNMPSFVRQLNMYGFHKIAHAETGALSLGHTMVEFRHPNFRRGKKHLLVLIRRKQTQMMKSAPSATMDPLSMSSDRLLSEVETLRHNQIIYKRQLDLLKKDNEVIWRHYGTMRNKFSKQQDIIEKMVRFMMNMAKPGQQLGMKRNFSQLALEAGSIEPSTSTTVLPQGSQNELEGLVIHEVTNTDQSVPLDKIFVPNNEGIEFPTSHEDSFKDGGAVRRSPLGGVWSKRSMKHLQKPKKTDISYLLMQDDQRNRNVSSTSQDYRTLNLPQDTNSPMFSNCDNKMRNQNVTATNAVSPNGTTLWDRYENPPLSPELYDVVDPSMVNPNIVYTPSMDSNFDVKPNVKRLRTQEASNETGLSNQVEGLSLPASKMKVALPTPSSQPLDKEDFSNHIETTEVLLNSIQEAVNAGTLNIDPSILAMMSGEAAELEQSLHKLTNEDDSCDHIPSHLLYYDNEILPSILEYDNASVPRPNPNLRLAIKGEPQQPQIQDNTENTVDIDDDPLSTPRINFEALTPPSFNDNTF